MGRLGRPVVAVPAMIVAYAAALAILASGLDDVARRHQATMGGGMLLAGLLYALPRRPRPILVAAMAAGAGLAFVAAILSMVPLAVPGPHRLGPVILGLAVAQAAAVIAVASVSTARGRPATILRWAGILAGLASVVMLGVESRSLLLAEFDMERRAWNMVGTVGWTLELVFPFAVLLLGTLAVLGTVGRRVEFGGAVPRPAVPFRCPRCGRRQRQEGASGCGRCGLDVRVELP